MTRQKSFCLITDKERLRLSCSVTKYNGDRTRKTDRIADRHVKIVMSKMSYAQVRERVKTKQKAWMHNLVVVHYTLCTVL